MCVSSSSLKHLPSLLSNTHGRTPGVFMFDKKIRASFQTLSKLLIIYRASPLWVQSKVEKAPLPRGNEWSHMQIALMLPESSPSQTCFRTPHWASLLIESFQERQAGCPTFFNRYHTDSLISTRAHACTAQLSSSHIPLYKQSGQSCPLMFIN